MSIDSNTEAAQVTEVYSGTAVSGHVNAAPVTAEPPKGLPGIIWVVVAVVALALAVAVFFYLRARRRKAH